MLVLMLIHAYAYAYAYAHYINRDVGSRFTVYISINIRNMRRSSRAFLSSVFCQGNFVTKLSTSSVSAYAYAYAKVKKKTVLSKVLV